MSDPQSILRNIRWAEATFALITLYLALTLPFPPAGHIAPYLYLHWYGMTTVALAVALLARRLSRPLWFGAAGLSAYFLLHFLAMVSVWRAAARDTGPYSPAAITLSYAVISTAAFLQLIVALQCWRARSLAGTPTTSAPVA